MSDCKPIEGDYLPDKYILTKDHFRRFVEMFKAWRIYFGLHSWEVRYALMDDDGSNARASLTIHDLGNHLAAVSVYTEWDFEPTDQMLWRCSFHECMELLIAEMNCLAEQRRWNYNEYDREGHRVIRTLETAVFDRMWEKNDELFNLFQSSDKASKRRGQKVSKPSKK